MPTLTAEEIAIRTKLGRPLPEALKRKRAELEPKAAPVVRIPGLPPSPVSLRRRLKYLAPRGRGVVSNIGVRRATLEGHDRSMRAGAAPVTGGLDGAGGGTPDFSDSNGIIIPSGERLLVYWWHRVGWRADAHREPGHRARSRRCSAARTMNALSQYRGTSPRRSPGRITVNSDPPNPFSDNDVVNMLTNLIENESVPEPGDDGNLLFMTIMPPGTASSGAFAGEHSYFYYWDYDFPFDYDYGNVHYAWVTNGGTLGSVTNILHARARRAVTDPEGSAILGSAGTCTQGGWCEIGDVCYYANEADGVQVQSYYSASDQACVVPAQNAKWAALGGSNQQRAYAGRNQDGHLEAFARGNDNALWHTCRTRRAARVGQDGRPLAAP